MKTAEIRFLKKGEQPALPPWAGLLPEQWQKAYIERRRPCQITVEGEFITAVLQTTAEKSMEPVWRQNAAALLESLKQEGVLVVIPPMEGELQRDILPLATGRRVTAAFAFAGAAEALGRRGKNPARCLYLLAGGDIDGWRAAISSMGNEVNRLAIFTEQRAEAEELAQELLEEWGLMVEVFSSPKNPTLAEADVVLCCGMEQQHYEYMLKEDTVFFDLAGNRPVLGRVLEKRPDMAAIDGFFFRRDGEQKAGKYVEAELCCKVGNFRDMETGDLLEECEKMGYHLSGFSVLGKRIKIRRKP